MEFNVQGHFCPSTGDDVINVVIACHIYIYEVLSVPAWAMWGSDGHQNS
jgi:hypothetical protein